MEHSSARANRFFPRHRSETRRRLVPLTVSFGMLSLVLTLALGVILGIQIQRQVTRQSLSELATSTQIAAAITVHTIVSSLSDGRNGIPVTNQQRQAQAGEISSAARVLVANSDVVAVDAVLANGMVIGGSGAPPVGTMAPRGAGFLAALRGVTQRQTLTGGVLGMTPLEQGLVGRYGSVLLVRQGVRLVPGGPIRGVVDSYTPLGPTTALAGADTRSIIEFLAVGLFVFWAVLFRLVVGASRALTRQSNASAHQATHDALTGLPNRALLRERTDQAMVASARSGTHVALILMDLDRFKDINDTLGHPYGDNLLKQMGPRLREYLRHSDTIARIGGDEFAVMLPDLQFPHQALAVAEKLNAALEEPYLLGGVMVEVGSSCGVVTSPDDGDVFDELLQHADVAMYAAKRNGYDVVGYDPLMDTNDPARLSLLADLKMAIEDTEQLLVYYQPQADLAKARFRMSRRSFAGSTPSAACCTQLVHPVRRRHRDHPVVDVVDPVHGLAAKPSLGRGRPAPQGVGEHLSSMPSRGEIADHVVQLLSETGVPVQRFELELTETAIMIDPDRALAVLLDLASHGIKLSIDDFGTGHSSLAYLKNLPVHEMKIDRSFISSMGTDSNDDSIVRSCLELAHNLNLTVVAEGVETRQAWQHLRDLGCPTVQGYFLSRPLPAPDFIQWLHGRQPGATGQVAATGSSRTVLE